MNNGNSIVIAMSGGVDSSTAAALLAESRPGAVIGLTMQLWDQRRFNAPAGNGSELPVVHAGRCCSLDDAYDARRVADHLGLPFYLVNFQARFEAEVVRPFVESYLAGETPIPCTLCNNYIKFEQLLGTARQIGAGRLATGHYARVTHNPQTGRYELRRARDVSKDQSYFLFGLTQEQLAATEFPLGELTKAEVRDLARARNLPVADKPESQEICFVPSGNYIHFIEKFLEEQGTALPTGRGEIVTRDGRVLGQHNGLHQFTVGQRRGLGLAAGKPLYVLVLDPQRNRVLVGEETELYRREVFAREPNWISIAPPAEPLRALVKVRHKHTPAAATVYPEDGVLRIVFDAPQRALTPGQAAVFYSADPADPGLVLGGAWLMAR
ncbi:MAG TPA: tRNA 2-thiouridine(34) synthase MnmA [Candidatus Xenobia bacterium]|nr:tRNA 2-thiouridine(34) synthase MnmA [Candidatus Xenobia bacterium]